MKNIRNWVLESETATGVELCLETRHILRISVLDETFFRVSLLKDGAWRLDRSWCVAPEGDVPFEGRERDDLSGYPCPPARLVYEGDDLHIETATMRLTVRKQFQLIWSTRIDDKWQIFTEERPTGGLDVGLYDHKHSHHLRRYEGDRIFGLGEKSGPLERTGKRYEMRNLDAMGYDAYSTDPLYKHVPFTMTRTENTGHWSVFYDNLAGAWFDLGNELDNYHLPYRSYRAEDGDLDYYIRWAPQMLDLVKAHVRHTGGTAFPPRWSLGYSGSTMNYTDAPDAQDKLLGFLDALETHDIPCDSFQLSSGYTSIGDKRYVFNWNTDKVPDATGMAKRFADNDVHLVANIKPCLLHDHPRFEEAEDARLFVTASVAADPFKGPEKSVFWDDIGSHLDFTNPDTIAWWKSNVSSALLEHGIASTWNDNNEYEIWDRKAQCKGFGDPIDIALIRPLMPILMTRASHEAQVESQPNQRPYLISRSGAPGLQRYAQTWSGDNRTDWKTIRWNTRMGVGMSLSGFYNIGHDVGGFSGPKPEAELFVRWVQNGIFHPRFTIHSWNDDATVNEPWMYHNMTPYIRDAIKLRYRIMPYLYTLLWQAAEHDEPMLRPTFLDHPDDPNCYAESDEFMLGRDLLVANIMDKSVKTRRVYLPQNGTGWWDFHAGTWHEGGSTVEVQVDLGSMPLFVRAGAVIPLGLGANRAHAQAETARQLAIFPTRGDATDASVMFEDDGISKSGPSCVTTIKICTTDSEISVQTSREGNGEPVFDLAEVILPKSELRNVVQDGAVVVEIKL